MAYQMYGSGAPNQAMMDKRNLYQTAMPANPAGGVNPQMQQSAAFRAMNSGPAQSMNQFPIQAMGGAGQVTPGGAAAGMPGAATGGAQPGGPAYGLTGANASIDQQLWNNALGFGAFAQPGAQSNNLQAAYSGALGPQAQQQAFANFTASPGQEWLQQQAEQGTLRNAAAIGGLGGGNVRQELQRQAMGLAQQDFQNQFNNLGTISDRGFQATNAAGNYGTQLNGAKAGYAYGAGQDIANNRAQTTSALNSLYGDYTSNIANLFAGAGGAQATSNQSLASLVANLATGSQSNFVNANQLPNTTQSPGNLGGIGQLLGGAGSLMGAF